MVFTKLLFNDVFVLKLSRLDRDGCDSLYLCFEKINVAH